MATQPHRSPHGAISAFTRVFDALWRNAGQMEQFAPRIPDFAALHPGYETALRNTAIRVNTS